MYREFVVVDHGYREPTASCVTYYRDFCCTLQSKSDGQEVTFNLRVEGCMGQDEYRAQRDAIEPLVKRDAVWQCYLAYQVHSNLLQLLLLGVCPINGDRLGAWTYLPGPIHLGGQAYLPLHPKQQTGPFVTHDQIQKMDASRRKPSVAERLGSALDELLR